MNNDVDFKDLFKDIEMVMTDYKSVVDETLGKVSKMGQVFSENISKIKMPKLKFSSDLILNIDYIMTMHKIQYPLFLESNKSFKSEVIKCKDDPIAVEKVIFDYVDNEYLNLMIEQWEKSSCIRKERFPILREAVELHQKDYYYACTSMLMCQLYGIVIDIYNYIENEDVEISEDSKENLAKKYEIDRIDSEKGKLIQLAHMPNEGIVIKQVIVEYFKKEILSSSESIKRWEHQPLRNKICHGDQLNFGTKEHSLKAILCINLLIKLGESIKIVIENIPDSIETE